MYNVKQSTDLYKFNVVQGHLFCIYIHPSIPLNFLFNGPLPSCCIQVEHLEELCPVEATTMHNTLSLCNNVLILDLTQEEAAVFCFL